MPNLSLGALAKDAAKTKFRGFNLTLPTGSQRPPLHTLSGQTVLPPPPALSKPVIGGHRAPMVAVTPMAVPPALFKAASSTKGDVDYQKGMHDLYNGLFDSLLDAIEFGFNLWRTSAGLVDVRINGPIANGGRLQGQPIDNMIMTAPSVASWSSWSAKIRDAVAKGIDQQLSSLARSVTVSGLPWYPAFAAYPGPQTPPTPNIPSPFMALQHDPSAMSPNNLKAVMRGALQGDFEFSSEFFESLAAGLQTPLQIWKTSQMVTGVVGMGPVPSFAPPYVPVGSVVNGTIIPGSHINT